MGACRRLVGALLILAGALLLRPDAAAAFSFSVEPSRIELTVPEGRQRGKTVRIRNVRSDRSIHLKAYVQDIVFLPDGTNDFPPPGSTERSCASWIKLVPDELDVPPGRIGEVRVTAAAPAGASGGYYAMVFFETGPSYTEKGLGVNFRIGALTEVLIPDTQRHAARLASLEVAPPGRVTVGIFNDSNVLIRPTGKLKLFNAAGKRLAQVEFNAQRVGVLPDSLRTFETTLEPLGRPGSYRVRAEIDYGSRYLLVGERPFVIE
jgi:hypothetical protein